MPQVELFSCDQYDMIVEALEAQLASKRHALDILNSDDAQHGHQSRWTPRDFGIPDLEVLIARVQTISADQEGK